MIVKKSEEPYMGCSNGKTVAEMNLHKGDRVEIQVNGSRMKLVARVTAMVAGSPHISVITPGQYQYKQLASGQYQICHKLVEPAQRKAAP